MSSLKKKAIQGTAWTIGTYGVSQILRFGSNLVLTRLLTPDLFGLMSLAYVFITGLHLFSDLGLNTSIVQNKRGDDPDFLNTAWTLQIIRGVGLWLCCLAIAIPAAHFYKEPQLVWVLPVAGLTTLISSFFSTGMASLNRHLSIKQLSAFELSGQLVTIAVMLPWAYFHHSVWAILAGSIASTLFQLVWSHRLSPNPPNQLKLDKTAMTEMFSFGKWIFLSTALTFFAMQSDRLILGKVLGLNLLGVYGIAVTLADLPKQVTMAVGGKIIFPMFTKFVDLPRREFCRKIRQGRWPILLATAPLLAIMISFGDVLITTLYDSRYQAAAWMIPLLALGVWPIILMTTVDGALFALGNAKINTWSYFASFVALITGIWVGGYFYGVVGAVAAVPLSNVPLYGVIAYGVHKEGLSNFDQDGYATALMLICATVLIWSRYMLGFPLPGLPG